MPWTVYSCWPLLLTSPPLVTAQLHWSRPRSLVRSAAGVAIPALHTPPCCTFTSQYALSWRMGAEPLAEPVPHSRRPFFTTSLLPHGARVQDHLWNGLAGRYVWSCSSPLPLAIEAAAHHAEALAEHGGHPALPPTPSRRLSLVEVN